MIRVIKEKAAKASFELKFDALGNLNLSRGFSNQFSVAPGANLIKKKFSTNKTDITEAVLQNLDQKQLLLSQLR